MDGHDFANRFSCDGETARASVAFSLNDHHDRSSKPEALFDILNQDLLRNRVPFELQLIS
jgi:hypothetical protein